MFSIAAVTTGRTSVASELNRIACSFPRPASKVPAVSWRVLKLLESNAVLPSTQDARPSRLRVNLRPPQHDRQGIVCLPITFC